MSFNLFSSPASLTYRFVTELPDTYKIQESDRVHEGDSQKTIDSKNANLALKTLQLERFAALNAEQREITQAAMQKHMNVANINFIESFAIDDEGQLSIFRTHTDAGIVAEAKGSIISDEIYASGTTPPKTKNVAYIEVNANLSFGIGSYDYNFWVMQHEIGHALGLKHPAPLTAFGLDIYNNYFGGAEAADQVDHKYTIMAYSTNKKELYWYWI